MSTMGPQGVIYSPYRFVAPQLAMPSPAVRLPHIPRLAQAAQPDKPTPLSEKFQRLWHYVGPYQAATLFLGGLAASFTLGWLVKGLFQKPGRWAKPCYPSRAKAVNALEQLAKGSTRMEDQTAIVYEQGLPSMLMFALKHPNDPVIQKRLLAYVGAMTTGYFMGSAAQGVQEIWVRREETQIRATLLEQLTHNFRKSIQAKTADDNRLREEAKRRLYTLLKQCNIPAPEQLVKPLPNYMVDRTYQYVGEPVHFAKPVDFEARFGESQKTLPSAAGTSPLFLSLLKGTVFGAGILAGGLAQFAGWVIRKQAQGNPLAKGVQKVVYTINNVTNQEALFLKGDRPLLFAFLGITAAAKLGKLLLDGYREIEVTRQHAATELRYQSYNWLTLDPAYHRISEEEALTDAINKLQIALPYEYNDRQALGRRIETILNNIGRNSTPKYMPMTPYVNLVAARG